MKRSLVGLFACLLSGTAFAQQDPVLMRINGKEIVRSEFEYFYHQKKAVGQSGTLNSYVDVFVNNELRAIAAETLGIDTARIFREELQAYRRQLVKSCLTDKETEEAKARELYDRMKTNVQAGQVQVTQIFKSLPQTITTLRLQEVQRQMEALYETLNTDTRTDFATFVNQYSDDKEISWIGWLQTPEEFERIAFSLLKGEISKPFFTPGGIHIVKVIDRKDVLPFDEIREELVERLSRQEDMAKNIEVLVGKLKEVYQYAPDKIAIEELMTNGDTSKTLFVLAGQAYSSHLFRQFAEAHPMGIRKQFAAFVTKSVLDYETNRLEQNPEFRFRLKEHRNQMLASAITKREVHTVTIADSSALRIYFKDHQSDYEWKTPHYKGAVLYGTDMKRGKQARKLLKKLPEEEWKDAIRLTFNTSSSPATVQIEQGIFAEGDHPIVDRLVFKKKEPDASKSYPFTAVIGKKQKGPERYEEILGQLIFDYQNHLDLLWAERLKGMGKVEINQEVLKTVNNH